METLKLIGLLLSLASRGSGFRVAPRGEPRLDQATGTEYPASPSCLMGSGFGLQRGCQYPEAMEPVPDCANAGFDQSCYDHLPSESATGYMRDVRSTSDYSSLTNVVVEAEGGGFGVSVSAGMRYMRSSQVSEKSLAFFIGASGRTHLRTIRRPVAMKLTAPAKALLQQDAEGFIRQYGLKYIHSISYGGSFLGSCTLNSVQTADAKDVQAFASFSVSKGFFSASGSTEFQNKRTQENLNVSVHINARWAGGTDIGVNFDNPEGLRTMFENWDRSWRTHATPLTITTRRWTDSAEVQTIVNAMSAGDQALFNAADITRAIAREISSENAKVSLTDTSVRLALAWAETRNYPIAESCLNSLSREVSAKMIQIELLTEADMLIIQTQWLAGNYDWFQAADFQERYDGCVAGVSFPSPTPAPAPSCASIVCLDRVHPFQASLGNAGCYEMVNSNPGGIWGDRPIYRNGKNGNYLYPRTLSDGPNWLVGPDISTTTVGLYSISAEYCPYEGTHPWTAWDGRNWVANPGLWVVGAYDAPAVVNHGAYDADLRTKAALPAEAPMPL